MLLPRLDIRGFRALADVTLAPLGRVNLITGRNGVGKSSVLGAVSLFANAGHPTELLEQLRARDELAVPGLKTGGTNVTGVFHKGPANGTVGPIRIGDAGAPASEIRLTVVDVKQPDAAGTPSESPPQVLQAHRGGELLGLVGLDGELRERDLKRLNPGAYSKYQLANAILPAGGLADADVEDLWDGAILAQREEFVTEVVRLIVPELRRINLVSRADKEAGRMPIVFRSGSTEAQALGSLGDGATRAFHIGLVMQSAAGGFALLDEFENGVHYLALVDLWRLVFAAATRFDVQVFATTHSRDCIEAFQQASAESPQLGALIRLDRRDGLVRAHVFDEETLDAAVRVGLEVR